jgi:hypothetical protein
LGVRLLGLHLEEVSEVMCCCEFHASTVAGREHPDGIVPTVRC